MGGGRAVALFRCILLLLLLLLVQTRPLHGVVWCVPCPGHLTEKVDGGLASPLQAMACEGGDVIATERGCLFVPMKIGPLAKSCTSVGTFS